MLPISGSESRSIHRLERFVSVEAIALHLNLLPEQIRKIDCWRYVIHVVGEGISTFVSYADLPPILGVELPTGADSAYWRKRFKARQEKYAPEFWSKFYAQKFLQTKSESELFKWGQLVGKIKPLLPQAAIVSLRGLYRLQLETSMTVYSSNSI